MVQSFVSRYRLPGFRGLGMLVFSRKLYQRDSGYLWIWFFRTLGFAVGFLKDKDSILKERSQAICFSLDQDNNTKMVRLNAFS
jgi:hypothetical protein